MEVQRFQLHNIGCFEQLEILLAPTKENNSNITVFIGNNGAGKTSLLKSLATSLSWLVSRIRSEAGSGSPIPELVIQNSKNSAAIDIQVSDKNITTSSAKDLSAPSTFEWRIAKSRKGRKGEHKSLLQQASLLANAYRDRLSADEQTALPLMAFYSVERVVIEIPLRIKGKHSFLQLDGYDNSLQQGVDFKRFFEWFRKREDTENESIIPPEILKQLQELTEENSSLQQELQKLNASNRDRQLTAVRTAISSFMPGFTNLRVRRKPRLHMAIDKDGDTFDVAQLSQGEKSLMTLVGDIARRLAMMNPGRQNPLEGEGIILIDEVDMHLHPRWQRTVLANLSKTFPHCQFVVSTHSPLVVSDMANTLCYSLDNGMLKEIKGLYGQDANQVLTIVMDTASRSEEIQEKLDRVLDSLQDGDLEGLAERQGA
ncbi:AAA family ATPase [Desulfotalea psychrophila]|uniref:Hypothetical ATP-binding protein n=1 Tax=Desulfotalea psychrophila (strain LSv54 / DSM 12343) TaxID=177439 RepID=Q6AR93_DESPS|nr:AAA family ATPase [Desulfotalea psychrophila]CAG35131.1 hypothetical ATP-binding protein [Desulfotalea psychrophila LSv54]